MADRIHTAIAAVGLIMIYAGLHVLWHPAAGVMAIGLVLLSSVIYARTRETQQ